jgi:hypothetical protein
MKRLAKYLLTSIGISLGLLAIGAVIWYFRRESSTSLQDTLFWVGAVPIGLFSIGLFGNYMGRGDSSYQLSRSVGGQSPNQRAVQDDNDSKKKIRSELRWLIAGFLVWLYSYIIPGI